MIIDSLSMLRCLNSNNLYMITDGRQLNLHHSSRTSHDISSTQISHLVILNLIPIKLVGSIRCLSKTRSLSNRMRMLSIVHRIFNWLISKPLSVKLFISDSLWLLQIKHRQILLPQLILTRLQFAHSQIHFLCLIILTTILFMHLTSDYLNFQRI